jgi:signal transduction histidine kinase/ActR/RegA family two-component response regulator
LVVKLLALYDIAQLLESGEDAELRVSQVLERLHALVPYEQCAVLDALPGRKPRLITSRATPLADRAELTATSIGLVGRLVDEHSGVSEPSSKWGVHLAVPLIGLDEVVGVLFVRTAEGGYEEQHVRALSVVAAQLAAYFCILNTSALEAERTHELEQARQLVEAANRAKDEFLALVSHELRTPLSTILNWADALRSTAIREADRLRAVEAIDRNARAQAKLIENLLDLSCVANRTLRLELRAVEPAKLIKEAIRALSLKAARKSIHLEVALDESITPLVVDARRLSQIVTNLVANAIKFTPEGGRVDVHLERAGGFARIRVVDTGSGISADVLPTLFERFKQADSSTTRPYGGLGVGLALVKDLVELHGGKVRAESPGPTRGATFAVDLPLPETDASSALETQTGPPRALSGIRVLVVDDDRDIREVLQFVLESRGALVTLAGSSAEALAALELSMPDVLLSDIAMPGDNGYDLMLEIVARKGEGAPPAAALSAFSGEQDLERARASGFRMQLAKPLDSEALVLAVASLAKSTVGDDPASPRVPGRYA